MWCRFLPNKSFFEKYKSFFEAKIWSVGMAQVDPEEIIKNCFFQVSIKTSGSFGLRWPSLVLIRQLIKTIVRMSYGIINIFLKQLLKFSKSSKSLAFLQCHGRWRRGRSCRSGLKKSCSLQQNLFELIFQLLWRTSANGSRRYSIFYRR